MREEQQTEETEPSDQTDVGALRAPLSQDEESRLRIMLRASRATRAQQAAAYAVWAQLKAGHIYFPALRDGDLRFGWDPAGRPYWEGDQAITDQIEKFGLHSELQALPSAVEREIGRVVDELSRLAVDEGGGLSSNGPALPEDMESALRRRLEESTSGGGLTEGHVAQLMRIVRRLLISQDSLNAILEGRVQFEIDGETLILRSREVPADADQYRAGG